MYNSLWGKESYVSNKLLLLLYMVNKYSVCIFKKNDSMLINLPVLNIS